MAAKLMCRHYGLHVSYWREADVEKKRRIDGANNKLRTHW
jgi:hypothetical protein